MSTNIHEGQRLVSRLLPLNGVNDDKNPCLGTVRYVGLLKNDPSHKVWLGIEWDSPDRGKHDGHVGEYQYFNCQRRWIVNYNDSKLITKLKSFDNEPTSLSDLPGSVSKLLTSASFVSADTIQSIQLGHSFGSGLHLRYCTVVSGEEIRNLSINDDSQTGTVRKIVEIVGIKKAEAHFSNLENLDSIDLDGYYINSSNLEINHSDINNKYNSFDKIESDGATNKIKYFNRSRDGQSSILNLFLRVKFLCLRHHLFKDFNDVSKILNMAPNTETLILSNSFFPRPIDPNSPRYIKYLLNHDWDISVPTIIPWYGLSDVVPTSYPHLLELDVHSSGIEWIDLYLLSQLFPSLQTLDISHSPQLFDLISKRYLSSEQKSLFSKLTSIMAHDCSIESWTMLFTLFEIFPSLSRIGANSNNLTDDSSLQETLQYQGSPITQRIHDLGIEDNQISTWDSIGILSLVFCNLSSLRWHQNPLQQFGQSRCSNISTQHHTVINCKASSLI